MTLPARSTPTAAGTPVCGAKTRAGTPCRYIAGYKTDHVGDGRCHLHGGLTPIKHGRYSTVKRDDIRQLIEQHAADPDPLNIFPELAAARALFQDYIERYDAWRDALIAWHESFGKGDAQPKPRTVLDIADAYRIVSEITKIVERIEKSRAENAISRPDLLRIMTEMGRVVQAHVSDPDTLERVKHDWLAIRV